MKKKEFQFLSETTSLDELTLLQESEDKDNPNDKSYFIEGIFMQAEVKNGNGRIYPRKLLQEATKPLLETISGRGLIGELEHPTQNSNTINYERAAIKILNLKEDGNNIIGKAKVLKEQRCGNIIHNLLKEGITIGVSSRGFGTVKHKGGVALVEDLILKTIDVVSNPSAPDALMTAIMESKSWVMSGNGELNEVMKKEIDRAVREKRNKKVLFKELIESIASSSLKESNI